MQRPCPPSGGAPIVVVPFLVHISNEAKHVERFAVRSKAMTLRPDGGWVGGWVRQWGARGRGAGGGGWEAEAGAGGGVGRGGHSALAALGTRAARDGSAGWGTGRRGSCCLRTRHASALPCPAVCLPRPHHTLHRTTHSTALHCTALHCTALHCTTCCTSMHTGNRYVKYFRNIRAIQDYLAKSGAGRGGAAWPMSCPFVDPAPPPLRCARCGSLPRTPTPPFAPPAPSRCPPSPPRPPTSPRRSRQARHPQGGQHQRRPLGGHHPHHRAGLPAARGGWGAWRVVGGRDVWRGVLVWGGSRGGCGQCC